MSRRARPPRLVDAVGPTTRSDSLPPGSADYSERRPAGLRPTTVASLHFFTAWNAATRSADRGDHPARSGVPRIRSVAGGCPRDPRARIAGDRRPLLVIELETIAATPRRGGAILEPLEARSGRPAAEVVRLRPSGAPEGDARAARGVLVADHEVAAGGSPEEGPLRGRVCNATAVVDACTLIVWCRSPSLPAAPGEIELLPAKSSVSRMTVCRRCRPNRAAPGLVATSTPLPGKVRPPA